MNLPQEMPYLTNGMPNLVEDLRSIINCITMGIVTIGFKFMPKNHGDLWIIKGPNKNFVVMLQYESEFKIGDEDVGAAFNIELEKSNDFSMHSEAKEREVNEAIVMDGAEYVLPHLIDSSGQPDNGTAYEHTMFDVVEAVWDTYSSDTENATNDLANFQDHIPTISNSNGLLENAADNLHDEAYCEAAPDHNDVNQCIYCNNEDQNGQNTLFVEECATYINLNCEIPVIDEDDVEALQLLDEDIPVMESSDANSLTDLPNVDTNSIDLMDQNISVKMEKIVPDNCSVLLESLDMSSLDNGYMRVQQKFPVIKQEHDEVISSSVECSHCGKKLEMVAQTGKMMYQCSGCDKLGYIADLNCDKMVRSQDSCVDCLECRIRFSDLQCFNLHMKDKHFLDSQNKDLVTQIHKAKPFMCWMCDKTFVYKKNYKQHKLTHTGESCKCLQCGKKFTQLCSLKRHKQNHAAIKNHFCLHCGKGFLCISDFEEHKRVHTGEKPYQCILCDKRFRTSKYLRRHKVIHSTEKRFKCLQCDMRFRYRDKLVRHERTHSGEKPFACAECEKRYSRKDKLAEHRRNSCKGKIPIQ